MEQRIQPFQNVIGRTVKATIPVDSLLNIVVNGLPKQIVIMEVLCKLPMKETYLYS